MLIDARNKTKLLTFIFQIRFALTWMDNNIECRKSDLEMFVAYGGGRCY